MPQHIELSRAAAERLLRLGVVGRIAFTAPDGPQILPVNYSVVGDAVVLRTTPYGVLGTHGRDARVAFEVDELDHEYQHAWSVVARGRSEVVRDAAELADVRAVWPPRPWADGTRDLFLRIPWDELTGRRLGPGWDPEAELTWARRLATGGAPPGGG